MAGWGGHLLVAGGRGGFASVAGGGHPDSDEALGKRLDPAKIREPPALLLREQEGPSVPWTAAAGLTWWRAAGVSEQGPCPLSRL